MAQPAFVRVATTTPGTGFTRYPSVQIDHGTGNNRVLLAWVATDSYDPNMDFVSCYAGCTASGSQSGGTAMTAAATAPLSSSSRQSGRLFYLAGASLPTGTSYVVGDATYTDRKPGIVAVLYDDAGGGPITVSAGVNIGSTGSSNSISLTGSTTNDLAVAGIYPEDTPTATSPAVMRQAQYFIERAGTASPTVIAFTLATSQWTSGTGVLLTGAGSSTPVGASATYFNSFARNF